MAINKILAQWRGAALRKMIELVENVDGSMDILLDGDGVTAGKAMPKYSFDASGNITGLVGVNGATLKIPRLVAAKTAVTDGAIQTADQVIGSLSIPSGSLNIGDIFTFDGEMGRDNGTDAYGTAQTMRMGVAGTVADTPVAATNLSSLLTGGGTQLSFGFSKSFLVVSIGANSVIRPLGPSGTMATSFNGLTTSAGAVGLEITLTGYNLSTQAGFVLISTTMGAATATKPRTGVLRLKTEV